MFRTIIFIICLSVFMPAKGQAPLCEAYTFNKVSLEKNAVSGYGLFNICEDSLGQIWAHNQKYLIRVHTHEATVFAGSGMRGISSSITQLFTTYNGHLWLATDDQLYELDPLRQIFTPHYLVYKNDTLKTADFTSCAYKNGLMVRTKQGDIFYYQPLLKTTTLLLKLDALPLLFAKCRPGSYKNVLLTTKKALYDIDSIGHIVKTPLADSMGSIDEVYNTGPHAYLTHHLGAKLYQVAATTGLSSLVAQLADIQRNMYAIQLHGQWLVALTDANGIYLYNAATNGLIHWASGNSQVGEKLQGWTMGMLQDKTGRLWILNNETILHLEPTAAYAGATAYWPHKDEFLNNLQASLAYSNLIAADGYHPYVINTYYNELRVYDTTTGKLVQKVAVPTTGHGRNFFCLQQASSNYWLVGYKTGYLVYDLKANKLLPTNTNNPLNAFFNIVEGADSFYCHTRLGVASIGKNNLRQAAFFQLERKSGITTDGKGNVWLLTQKGVYKKQENGNWLAIDTLLYTKILLTGAGFTYNPFTKRLMVLSATNLYELDPATATIVRQVSLNKPELPLEYIFFEPLSANEVWLAAGGGAAIVYNIATQQTTTIGANQGWWPQNIGSSANSFVDKNGSFWITNDAGFMHLNPLFFKQAPPSVMPPAINELLLQYRPWPIHPATYTSQPLEVSYKAGHIAIKMGASEPDSIEYILQPYDAEWHKGSIAVYTNLDGGNYLLKARTKGPNGSFSPESSLMLKIIPPIWKQWWFRILAAIIVSAAAWWLIQRRIQRQKKDFQTKIQLAQSELKAIRSQMNPHFIFNCMTAIDGLIAGNNKQMASQYLSKFSKLLRRVLQHSEKQLITLGEDLETLALYLQLEQLRMHQQLNWEIDADDELKETVMVPPLLLQPFVENAIIHGLKPKGDIGGILKVMCRVDGANIVIVVYDNGVGRQPKNNSGHQSMGTQLTEDRLRLLENVTGRKTDVYYNDLKNADGTAKGTEVIITIRQQIN